MNVSETEIDLILRAQDVEGLLAPGAPDDEYVLEAAEIARALEALSPEQANDNELSDRVMRVWSRVFGPFGQPKRLPGATKRRNIRPRQCLFLRSGDFPCR